MPSQDEFDFVLSMGFTHEQVTSAFTHTSSVDDAVRFLTDGPQQQHQPALPPPPPPRRGSPTSPPPSRPQQSEDDELAQAIRASLEPAGNYTSDNRNNANNNQTTLSSSTALTVHSSSSNNNNNTNNTNNTNYAAAGDPSSSSANTEDPTRDIITNEQDKQIALALEESMIVSIDKEDARDESQPSWDAAQPAHQRYRSSLDTPVALRTCSPRLRYFASYLASLYYASPALRNTLFTFPFDPISDPENAGYAGYWCGNPACKTTPFPQDPPWLIQLRALQRLFVLMKFTRRKWLNVQDVVDAFELTDSREYTHPVELTERIFNNFFGDSWNKAIEWLRERRISENPEKEDEANEEFEYNSRIFSTTGTLLNPDDPWKPDPHDVATIFPAQVNELQSFDTYSASDQSLWPPDKDGGGTSKSLIITPSNTITMSLHRTPTFANPLTNNTNHNNTNNSNNNTSTSAVATATAPSSSYSQPRKPCAITDPIYLDRYSFPKIDTVLERRKKLKELADTRRKDESILDSLYNYQNTDVRPVLTDVEHYLSKIAPSSEDDNSSRKARQEKLLSSLHDFITFSKSQEVDIQTRMQENLRIANSVFDTDDMKEWGPYRAGAVLVHTGFYGRDDIYCYVRCSTPGLDGNEKEKETNENDTGFFKIMDTQAVPVSSEEALCDSSEVTTVAQSGAYMIIYSNHSVLRPCDLTAVKYLVDAVDRDNAAFANDLPQEITSEWDIKAQPQPQPQQVENSSSEQELKMDSP